MKISPPVRLTWRPAFREGAAQGVERQLLAPLAFDVQQIADVAELARQVAPHGRFVDEADRQRHRRGPCRPCEKRPTVCSYCAAAIRRQARARAAAHVRGERRRVSARRGASIGAACRQISRPGSGALERRIARACPYCAGTALRRARSASEASVRYGDTPPPAWRRPSSRGRGAEPPPDPRYCSVSAPRTPRRAGSAARTSSERSRCGERVHR